MHSTTQDIELTDGADAAEGNGLADRLCNAMLTVIARRQTRRVVQGLSEAQLRDIGIDRTAVLGDRPVIEVDVRLATYLASLR